MFKTIADVRYANQQLGHHWFDRSSMRFFNTTIESSLYGGRFFITSERMDPRHPKKYTVREALPTGEIKTVGEFHRMTSIEDARDAARNLARDGVLA